MQRFSCSLATVESFNGDTRKVILEIPTGSNAEFKAGQYLEIILPDDNKCPFSIANSPVNGSGSRLELHIRPTPESRDSAIIEELLDNASDLTIEFPKGDCYLETPPENKLILLAASTGITQMKSIIEFLLPKKTPHGIYLYWGVLSEKDLYLSHLCESWTDSFIDFTFVPVVSEAHQSPGWTGRTGLVGDAVLEDFSDLSDVTVYVSGGPGMVYATLDNFVERGMPTGNMFSDVFSYAPRSGN